MDEATRLHAFEPFYTTKEVGAGTGLGLATVFGVVQQAGGTIHLETSPGMGTVFSLFFPVVAPPSANGLADMRPSPKTPPQGPPDGTLPTAAPPADITAPSPTPVPSAPQEPVASPDDDHAAEKITLLLVEDEDAVRGALRRMLERAGYSVIEARHGADALQRWHEMPTVIDAVITDVRMPEMGGPELVRLLRRSAPNIPVVYMSGYSKEELRNGEDPQTAFISKPFSREQLIEAIRMVMVPLPAL
jgi:CheY-like chemotaxis protein